MRQVFGQKQVKVFFMSLCLFSTRSDLAASDFCYSRLCFRRADVCTLSTNAERKGTPRLFLDCGRRFPNWAPNGNPS